MKETTPAPDPSEAATLATIRQFNGAVNRHDLDAVMALMTGVDLFRVRNGKVAEKLSYVKG